MTAQYKLIAIRKRYGSKIALQLEELEIWPGRLHILTGPNGSGKSTLLNLLAFLTRPDLGEIAFAGEPVTWHPRQLRMLRKRATLLHQSPYLFAGTVAANVAFGLKARGLGAKELGERVAESLRLVGLAGFEGRKARQLSGGEAQRVALARALAVRPDVLLLDEPLSNVDKETTRILEPLLASLPARGTTVVMSTHDPRLGEWLEGNVIRLEGGTYAEEADRISQPGWRTANDSNGRAEI